jgi:hypothetical protein
MHIRRSILIFAAVLIAIVVGFVGQSDFEEEQRQQDNYCFMVKQWKQTNGKQGWPAYNGEQGCG